MSRIDRPDRFAAEFLIRAAVSEAERMGAAALRRRVFVSEQGVFAEHDRDAIDAVALPLVALTGGAVAGTVRIHEAAPGVWWGSRLAVAPEHRRVGRLGAELIRLAVGTARARGAREFHAHVQRQNAPLFLRLRWRIAAEVDLHGRPHLHMLADLASYAPVEDPATGWRMSAAEPRP
jgi:putative N-acetyltransferase (TIGR04045 family)